jgi:hypothetical protein
MGTETGNVGTHPQHSRFFPSMFGARKNVLPIFGDVGIALAKVTFVAARLVASSLEWDFILVSCGFYRLA